MLTPKVERSLKIRMIKANLFYFTNWAAWKCSSELLMLCWGTLHMLAWLICAKSHKFALCFQAVSLPSQGWFYSSSVDTSPSYWLGWQHGRAHRAVVNLGCGLSKLWSNTPFSPCLALCSQSRNCPCASGEGLPCSSPGAVTAVKTLEGKSCSTSLECN